MMALWATGAQAHSWYPRECCSGHDCAAVISVKVLGDGTLVVRTQHGEAHVPATLPRRDSPDGQMHACINSSGTLLCVFYPPAI